jgi:hypothetical protein
MSDRDQESDDEPDLNEPEPRKAIIDPETGAQHGTIGRRLEPPYGEGTLGPVILRLPGQQEHEAFVVGDDGLTRVEMIDDPAADEDE